MNMKQAGSGNDMDERMAALLANANAVRATAAAVEGTIGPKGLDTMLVDRFGEVVITNDGVTILDKMDTNHPAARMLINIAKAQQAEVGDGTTTATILASSLVDEGVRQVLRGVPVARVIEGMRKGLTLVVEKIRNHARTVNGIDDSVLRSIAMVAGREHDDIADLVVEAARLIDLDKLREANFKLSDTVFAQEGADNEVFMGVVVDRVRMNKEMPGEIKSAKLMVFDDALEPEEIEEEALSTEAGFKRYVEFQDEFKINVQKIVELGVKVVLTDRGVSDAAEEILTDAGIMVLERVASNDLRRTAEHVGARMIKRTGLKKSVADLKKYLGKASKVYEDEKLEQVRIIGGSGKPMATILVGAATEEVVGERERITKDAASSVQAAIRGGFVPGGGSLEIALSRELATHRKQLKGMAAYGLDSVINALQRPLAQIVENAGFNHLEKVEEVITRQNNKKSDALGIDCDSGNIIDMVERGIVDSVPVKLHAIKAAGEVALAILRIDTIIKKREEGQNASRAERGESDMPDF